MKSTLSILVTPLSLSKGGQMENHVSKKLHRELDLSSFHGHHHYHFFPFLNLFFALVLKLTLTQVQTQANIKSTTNCHYAKIQLQFVLPVIASIGQVGLE